MSIILAIIVFSILVLIHEFGHFLLAKKNGIGVVEFSVGMGPRLASFEMGETRYSLKIIPFGGSCRMVGEDEESDRDDSFNNKSVWARISVVAAGPIFNFILALVLSVVIIGMAGYDRCSVNNVVSGSGAEKAGLQKGDVITEYDGKNIVISRDLWLYQYMNDVTEKPISIKYKRDGKEYSTEIEPGMRYGMGISYSAKSKDCEIVGVTKGGAAEEAGMKTGDIIKKVDGNEINGGESLSDYFEKNPLTEKKVNILVDRDGEEIELELSPKGRLGTGFSYDQHRVKTDSLGTLRYSFTELRYDMESTIKSFGMLFTGKVTKDDVSGPVGIVSIIGDTYDADKAYGAKAVFLDMAYLTVLFSVNLGVLNLFPFPALDGGRLVFLFIEAIRRKPVPRDKEAIVHFVGMVMLMILMVLILVNDIGKLL